MSEYSQGIASDGAVILKNGVPMTPEEILVNLRERDALEQELAAVKEQQRWIPVSERLPDDHGIYLVYCKSGMSSLFRYDLDKGFTSMGNTRLAEDWEYWSQAITHWMPLPAPPTQGDAE